ncbi:beta-galactosidase trimerization domain-containing protein, partial [Nocardioides sp. NPDC057772]|uniref:beta-galactosidase n=1 Tax=Nocardioides sp. NPDC057772 TaxID=3346245 RepID=UPI00366BBE6E
RRWLRDRYETIDRLNQAWGTAFWSQRYDDFEVVVAPTLYTVSDADAARVAAAAEAGSTVLLTFFSGIVDEHDHVRLGGYPGAFRDLLGIHTEEFHPLLDGERLTLDDGTTADLWSERTALHSAEAVRTWAEGPLAGLPAVTRHEVGAGAAWYAGTRPDGKGVANLVDLLLAESGVEPEVSGLPVGVEAVRRHAPDGSSFLFVINHTAADIDLAATGLELLRQEQAEGRLEVPAYGVAVLHEH